MRQSKFFVTLMLFAASRAATAQPRLPAIIADHAVLQRERPIHLWGWASPGAHIIAHFHTQSVPGEVDNLGHWSLYLQPEPAGGPYTLTLSGDGPEKTVTDLLVGDVWLASGQSNMEMPLRGWPGLPIKDSDHEIATATNPRLRLLLVARKSSDFPVSDVQGTWTLCTPDTARDFSAVAYFFGREIAARENVPIGLIDSTWGGTPADSWTSLNMLGTNPALLPAFAARAAFTDHQAELDATIAAEKRADAEALAAGKPKPVHPWHPDQTSWTPGALYNGMIAPFTPMALKGFLWYQGEANSGPERAPYYSTLFSAMIKDWRNHFAQGDLPFLFVQISSFNAPPGEDWGMVRDQQRRTLALSNTAMAVSLDKGQADSGHPPDKQTVGARLALAARALAYADPVAYQGPLFREVTTELQPSGTTALRVWFDHARGLTFHGKAPTGFEVAGPDHHFQPATAQLSEESVLVTAPAVQNPTYVRFGWNGFVQDSLYNADGLPTSTFTSEPAP